MNGDITLLFDRDGMRIELRDNLSGITFLQGRLNQEQTMQVLARQALVDFEFDVYHLDKVGRKVSRDVLVFEMPECDYKDRDNVAAEAAIAACPDGWEPQLYFRSRESFFQKNGKKYGRTHILKWEAA